MGSGGAGPRPHLQQIPHGFSKAHRVHGHGHRVGEGKDEADGAAQLRSQAPRDEEVGAPCGTETPQRRFGGSRPRSAARDPAGTPYLTSLCRW